MAEWFIEVRDMESEKRMPLREKRLVLEKKHLTKILVSLQAAVPAVKFKLCEKRNHWHIINTEYDVDLRFNYSADRTWSPSLVKGLKLQCAGDTYRLNIRSITRSYAFDFEKMVPKSLAKIEKTISGYVEAMRKTLEAKDLVRNQRESMLENLTRALEFESEEFNFEVVSYISPLIVVTLPGDEPLVRLNVTTTRAVARVQLHATPENVVEVLRLWKVLQDVMRVKP